MRGHVENITPKTVELPVRALATEVRLFSLVAGRVLSRR